MLDLEAKKPLVYLVTKRRNPVSLCFREVSEDMRGKVPTCIEVLENKEVEYIASSFENIYIEYADCVLVYNKRLEFLERID